MKKLLYFVFLLHFINVSTQNVYHVITSNCSLTFNQGGYGENPSQPTDTYNTNLDTIDFDIFWFAWTSASGTTGGSSSGTNAITINLFQEYLRNCGNNPYLSIILIPQIGTTNLACPDQLLFPQYQDGINHEISVLTWQYYSNTGWVDVPNLGFEHRYPLNASVIDLLGTNYDTLFTGNLQLRYKISVNFSSDVLYSPTRTISINSCSPQLLNFTQIDTLCSYSQDGSFNMILDRNLGINKKLVVSLFYEFVTGSNNYSLLTQNDTINLIDNGNGTYTYNWPNQIFAGNYKVKYQTFDVSTPNPVWTSLEGTESGFTIGNPPPIFISGTSQNVNCFNGSDGMIQLNASGGVGAFTYEINGNNNWIPFSNPNTHTISNNTQGVYNIKIKDANGCTEQQ